MMNILISGSRIHLHPTVDQQTLNKSTVRVICCYEETDENRGGDNAGSFLFYKKQPVREQSRKLAKWFKELEFENVTDLYLLSDTGSEIPLAIIAAIVRANGHDDSNLWKNYNAAPDALLFRELSRTFGKPVNMKDMLARKKIRLYSPMRKAKPTECAVIPESVFVFQ